MEKPPFVTMKPVFDEEVLRPGRAVRLGGYDEEGEKQKGIWLIQDCNYDRLVLINHRGTVKTIYIDDVLREDECYRTTITPLEG